ncbi:hypothetical protein UA08_05357 [Talaromyces atroroseus]|uniref:LysM domain-containing protein n=1 Tax=Talaromyces atroroseus TaxID=1441469 RepID=A0A225AYJ8_TALAT|nr:hypothetical protein UA08_05357 [Talaromyces atroroseus]OKL59545.1 hypothetical protein UA08_05357 [Talaromyces atroroseus]
MSVLLSILAAGSLPALIFGAPVPSLPSRNVDEVHSFQKRGIYTVFGGNGDVSDGWPSLSDWVSSFDEMFEANKETMSSSCAQWAVANNSDDEINDLSNSIQSVASSTGVDARFILAIVMQESQGCVRVPTTNYGVVNPGLMQSHDGAGSCNNGDVQDPCPASEITQMINDGTAGTSSGDGLQQLLAKTGVDDVTKYYMAARLYNSGSIASDGNLGQGIATHCYVSDVANRLTGWSTGASSCDSSTIGDLTGSSGSTSPSSATSATTSTSATSTTATPTETPTVTPTVTPTTVAPTTTSAPVATEPPATFTTTTTTSPVPTTTTTPVTTTATTTTASPTSAAATATASSDPVYPGAVSSCTKYYTVVSGDYCLQVEAEVGITASQLMDWNSGLDATCSNLWLGYQYCIQA